MANENTCITDPLGHRVFLINGLFEPEAPGPADEEEADLGTAIRRPALIIETTRNGSELHFFRTLAWNSTILVSARKEGEAWLVFRFLRNPSFEHLAGIMKDGKQLL